MDVSNSSSTIKAPALDKAAQARSQALADNRRAASEQRVDEASASRNRQSEALAATREAIARAIGANTRLSITRSSEALTFVYRAIDVDSGEIVQEWPEDSFLDLVKNVRGDLNFDVAGGLVLDEVA